MTAFTTAMPPYRITTTDHGDDVQRVAAREMGDANRWPEIVWLNGLLPPYITDDPQRVTDGVLLSGSFIKVPAPTAINPRSTESGQVFERDCVMANRQLRASASGDIEVVSGVDNLSQQLTHRVSTPRGQARRHPEYGCLAYRLIGTVNGKPAALLAAQYVEAAVLSDYRIRSVQEAEAVVTGESIKARVKAETIAGGAVDIISG